MYQLLTLLTGAVLAVMIMMNGGLAARYGIFVAAAIIHAVGSLFALTVCVLKKEKMSLWYHQPVWIYLGGAIGVLTTLFNNSAYGKISMTSIVALGLTGQLIMSILIDCLGLFGMERRSMGGKSVRGYLWGGLFVLAGILVMLDTTVISAVHAISLSFCAGIMVVLSLEKYSKNP